MAVAVAVAVAGAGVATYRLSDGMPTDPAAWTDWLACVREALAEDPAVIGEPPAEA